MQARCGDLFKVPLLKEFIYSMLDLTVLSRDVPVPQMVGILVDLVEGFIGSFLTQRASLSQQALIPWNQKELCLECSIKA